jgi:hypothetical protein
MTTPLSDPVIDAAAAVWPRQHTITADTLLQEGSDLAHLYIECARLYRLILRHASSQKGISKDIYRGLENGYSSLVLWADDYGVGDGGLDVRLERCQELQRTTLEFLVSIGKTLSESTLKPFFSIIIPLSICSYLVYVTSLPPI